MIALSIALGIVGLAALWTARDVFLRLHEGSEARDAIETAKAVASLAAEHERAADAKIAAQAAEIEKMRAEHVAMKARLAMGGRPR